jgi:glycosyltransferase involved in cell wall biosynthesis
MNGFEENEISINANGGTEIAKRKLASILDPELLSNFQIICSRPRELNQEKIRIFWNHDLPEDPEVKKYQDQEFFESFHKHVFISNWQYARYQLVHGVHYNDKSVVLESGIEPAPNSALTKPDDGKIHIAYTSTPQRGLDILVAVFKEFAKTNPNIHLHVYSSFKIYGWEEADKQFEPLYDEIRNHPQMTYHGFVQNETLKEALNGYHIFAYPSVWLETSCRAMLEAMSAGLVCVHPNYGSLPETSGALNFMYHGNMDDRNAHANTFANYLNAAIKFVEEKKQEQVINFNKIYVDGRYGIERIKGQWDALLRSLLLEYPTIESRKIRQKILTFRTT